MAKKTKGQKLAQRLGNLAPNHLDPVKYFEVLSAFDEDYIGYDPSLSPGCQAVGQGSNEDNLYHSAVHILGKDTHDGNMWLVGKGITFDSGGYSIKSHKNMHEMKYDMMGSASVLGALYDLDFPVGVNGALCISENRVSHSAILPGHEIRYTNGKNVIVEDTDAEGRLVLADGILEAKRFNAKLIITVATLTGAIISALGKNTVGVFSNDFSMAEKVVDSFKETGVDGWYMPILEKEILKHLTRPGNKLSNYTFEQVPGHSMAATFLKQFVGDTHWIHLDMAGVGHNAHGARSEMVKVLTNLVNNLK